MSSCLNSGSFSSSKSFNSSVPLSMTFSFGFEWSLQKTFKSKSNNFKSNWTSNFTGTQSLKTNLSKTNIKYLGKFNIFCVLIQFVFSLQFGHEISFKISSPKNLFIQSSIEILLFSSLHSFQFTTFKFKDQFFVFLYLTEWHLQHSILLSISNSKSFKGLMFLLLSKCFIFSRRWFKYSYASCWWLVENSGWSFPKKYLKLEGLIPSWYSSISFSFVGSFLVFFILYIPLCKPYIILLIWHKKHSAGFL